MQGSVKTRVVRLTISGIPGRLSRQSGDVVHYSECMGIIDSKDFSTGLPLGSKEVVMSL